MILNYHFYQIMFYEEIETELIHKASSLLYKVIDITNEDTVMCIQIVIIACRFYHYPVFSKKIFFAPCK